MPKLTSSSVLRTPVPKGGLRFTLTRCTSTKGFMVRTMASGERSYLVWPSVRGSKLRPQLTIGKVSEIAFDDALEKAQNAIAMARRGEDPSVLFTTRRRDPTPQATGALGAAVAIDKKPVTLNELWDLYMRAGAPSMKRGGGVKQDTTIRRDSDRYGAYFRDTLIGRARLRDIDEPWSRAGRPPSGRSRSLRMASGGSQMAGRSRTR